MPQMGATLPGRCPPKAPPKGYADASDAGQGQASDAWPKPQTGTPKRYEDKQIARDNLEDAKARASAEPEQSTAQTSHPAPESPPDYGATPPASPQLDGPGDAKTSSEPEPVVHGLRPDSIDIEGVSHGSTDEVFLYKPEDPR